ncbi:MAG: DUF2062 domain-containing protein [Proteobacteria bacterium]|nr:MAG: DUF2062 domain-containing protein [Pseudomonadota bacterium]
MNVCRMKPPCFRDCPIPGRHNYRQLVMPRKQLKRVLPTAVHIRGMWGMSRFSHWLKDENLWHINRRSVSLGVGIGLFFCYWPIPVQMLLALVAAIAIRANLPISVALVWVTNPLTVLPMYAPAYLLGAWLLDQPLHSISELTFATLGRNLEALWLGCLIIGTMLSITGWALVRAYWHWHVQHSWHLRKRARAQRDSSAR